MARSWTTRAFEEGDQFKADHFAGEANAISQQVNGNLDQNGMPLISVTNAMFKNAVQESNTFGDNTQSTYLPTQSYHVNTFNAANEATLPDILGAPGDYQTNWEVDSWYPFWQSFDGVDSTNMFNSIEGMLYGGVTISCERRPGRIHLSGSGVGASKVIAKGVMYSVGIFVNGVLVADSGAMSVGGYTLDLPFAVAIGSEYCEVEVKWKADQDLFLGETTLAVTEVLDFYKYFICAGMHLFTRNQYR